MKQLIIGIMAFCLVGNVNAQSVTLNFPEKVSSKFLLLAQKGLGVDTLVNSVLDAQGHYIFKPTKKYLPGVWVLQVSAKNKTEFIWNGNENPVIANTISNSPENEKMTSLGKKKMELIEKQRLCEAGAELYANEPTKRSFFTTEQKNVLSASSAFDKTLAQSKLYAAHYLNFISLEQHYQPILNNPKQSVEECKKFHQYFLDSLDMAKLYTSGRWFNIINMSLNMYRTGDSTIQAGVYRKDFVKDMIYLLARTQEPEVLTMLGNDVLMISEQFGWDNQRNEILDYLVASNKIEHPTPFMQKLYELKQLKVGQKAPDIVLDDNTLLTGHKADKYIVMFFESACGHCEDELKHLKENYGKLKAKNIAVLTISADIDKLTYETTSNMFPWFRLCDFKGLQGKNFKNFGVTGTPVFFVIDSTGTVMGRYAQVKELGLLN